MKKTMLPDFSAVRGRHLLIGLSGGPDSVALTHMLADVREELDLTLSAAHIDHCIRPESAEDAQFCRELCAGLDIPFYCERIDIPAAARERGIGLETAARNERHLALGMIMLRIGADLIVLAHHLNDQAETVLMHLLRGCGPDGIDGMELLNDRVYRPLLDTPRKTLMDYLEARGLPWRTDATNLTPCTPRNALRLHAIPALEESYPAAASAIARYGEAARCENRFMEKLTNEYIADHLEFGPYGARLLRPDSVDEAIMRRALRQICGPSLSHEKLRELAALCRARRGKAEISRRQFCEKTPNALYFLPESPAHPRPVPLSLTGKTSLEGIGRIAVSRSYAIPIVDDPFRQALRRDALRGAVLRTRRDGDRMRPMGCGDRLLSDVLTDRQIDRPLRDTLPLLAVDNRILWAVGVGISEEVRLQSENDDAVMLEWKPARY